jgi:hypothetical protein
MLIGGLISAASTIVWTFVCIVAMLLLFAVVGVELISKSPLREQDEAWGHLVAVYYATVPDTMCSSSSGNRR